MLTILYINLDSSVARRQALETNIARTVGSRALLHRIEACKAGSIAHHADNISQTEIACYESHLRAIHASLKFPGHTMIVEDDVCFSPKTFSAICATFEQLQGTEWDLIYTDLIPLKFGDYVALSHRYDRLQEAGQLEYMELNNRAFGGATAYIVNAKSKVKLLQALPTKVECPYDLALMKLIGTGTAKAYLIFPFVTTINELAEDTQIAQQQPETDLNIFFFNAMRRLLWVDATLSVNPVALLEAIKNLQHDSSPRGQAVRALFGLVSDPHLNISI